MDPSAKIRSLLSGGQCELEEVAREFDRLSPGDAVAAARSLSGRRLQRPLWTLAASAAAIRTEDLLPRDYEPMKPVRFFGKNSLPAFTQFEKICCRPPAGQGNDRLWGFNETRVRGVVGPGYFVVHDTPGSAAGGAAFDYTMLPERPADGWPPIKPNDAGLSRFVYNGTIDYMRRVARDVFIGSATRGDKPMDSYFVLVREAI